eukprot:scaffold75667_cov48-Prasinocladus_malaysianus.AAC.1
MITSLRSKERTSSDSLQMVIGNGKCFGATLERRRLQSTFICHDSAMSLGKRGDAVDSVISAVGKIAYPMARLVAGLMLSLVP